MKEFLSFGADCMSIYLMSTRILKDNIDENLCSTISFFLYSKNNPSFIKQFGKFCCEAQYMLWENQDL